MDSRDLRILKIGPKERPFGSGYTNLSSEVCHAQPRTRDQRRHRRMGVERPGAARERQRALSASIAEINQPISAVVMNAEAALRLLLAQPTDTGAVRRLLACIVKDGMRAGDIVNRTPADGGDRHVRFDDSGS